MTIVDSADLTGVSDKPELPFWGLWNMNFGNLGIQFGWALEMANTTAICTKLGAHPDFLPLLGAAAPITGLLVQPVVGALSDRTWSARFGRRRPYFLAGAILSSLLIFLLPASPSLILAAVSLWILDASLNVSLEPYRAFVADKLPVSQRAAGYLMQSFFIGFGAILADVLPWLFRHFGVTAESATGVPLSILYSFRIGAFALIASVLWTVVTTKEDPPTDPDLLTQRPFLLKGIGGIFHEIGDACRHLPFTMRQLFWVQFLAWYGIVCVIMVLPLATAKNVFGTTKHGLLFDKATEWQDVCLAIMSVACCAASPILPMIAAKIGRPKLYAACLAIGGVGFLSISLVHSRYLMFAPMVAYGIAWAAVMSLPYAILSLAIPKERMGVYMGVFNYFIVIPQISFVATMPLLLKYVFAEDPIKPILVGGICLIGAGALCLKVKELAAVPGSPEPVEEL
jgi:maltose/moltooligosaccharide transporter